MWIIIRALTKLRNDLDPLVIAQSIVPRMRIPQRIASFRGHKIGMGGRVVGFPGAGMFHGKTNVARSATYRATYVPGGFNVVRDQYRRLRASALLEESLEVIAADNEAYVAERLAATQSSGEAN